MPKNGSTGNSPSPTNDPSNSRFPTPEPAMSAPHSPAPSPTRQALAIRNANASQPADKGWIKGRRHHSAGVISPLVSISSHHSPFPRTSAGWSERTNSTSVRRRCFGGIGLSCCHDSATPSQTWPPGPITRARRTSEDRYSPAKKSRIVFNSSTPGNPREPSFNAYLRPEDPSPSTAPSLTTREGGCSCPWPFTAGLAASRKVTSLQSAPRWPSRTHRRHPPSAKMTKAAR